eukprot:NODE_244_length_11882_cov_0.560214.p13 type:complete len:108 gc:universal NODE_244_length_11882_cov_0.560214:915-1238(+)
MDIFSLKSCSSSGIFPKVSIENVIQCLAMETNTSLLDTNESITYLRTYKSSDLISSSHSLILLLLTPNIDRSRLLRFGPSISEKSLNKFSMQNILMSSQSFFQSRFS